MFPLPKRYRDILLHPFMKKETTALEDVNMCVENGELFGLLGPNGSGKTTLLKILSTLILPTGGKAFINGLDVTFNEKKIKEMIGYVVSDERSFFWRLTGRQNLRFFASLNNITPQKTDMIIETLVPLMGLEGEIDKIFQSYSSGNKQKMAIARGLFTNPQVLFLDEPTKSLDPLVAHNLRCFIKDTLVERYGKTVLIATNNMKEAEMLCNRIAVIHDHTIKECGTIKEIKERFVKREAYDLVLEASLEEIKTKVSSPVFTGKIKRLEPVSSQNGKVLLTIEMDTATDRISDIIEWLVQSGIAITSCTHEALPLNELFQRCINA